jgi:hypothetical protein
MKLTIFVAGHVAGVFRHVSNVNTDNVVLVFLCQNRYVTVPRHGRSFLFEEEL